MGPVNMVIENNAIISVQSLDVDYTYIFSFLEISIGENISVSRYKESRFRNIRRRDNWTNRAKRIRKTTLLKSIFGELRPESGKIETDGG